MGAGRSVGGCQGDWGGRWTGSPTTLGPSTPIGRGLGVQRYIGAGRGVGGSGGQKGVRGCQEALGPAGV